MKEIVHYLYKITNLVNGKLYIGVTKNLSARKKQHFYNPNQNKNSIIKKAVNKYGPENFSFDVLCVGSKEYIYDLEVKAISAFNTVENGYNIKPGGAGGTGHKVASRSDDEPVFVSGFWFPNRRVALASLGMAAVTFHNRKRQGILGEVSNPRKGSVYDAPQYVRGIWFNTLREAAEALNEDPELLYLHISLGLVEEDISIKNKNSRVGKWKFKIDNIVYDSILSASKQTGISRSKISNNLNENKEGFTYEYSYEISKRPYQ